MRQPGEQRQSSSGSGSDCRKTRPSERSAYKEFRALTTRWMDNDVYGHMNNVVHYSLFDTAVNGWLIEQGVLDLAAGKQIGLVVETGCRYFSELAFPDNVTAGLRVARLGTSSVRYEIGLFRNDDAPSRSRGILRPCLCRSPDSAPGPAQQRAAECARAANRLI